MDYSNPTLLVISGPNGAGKSTHIQAILPPAFDGIWSFDRDNTRVEFEQTLKNEGVRADEIFRRATEMMEETLVEEMKKAIQLRNHFVLETPLSHPDYWAYLDLFDNNGYQIQLNYLCLDSVGDCIARVGQRVIEGGHYVEPSTIKGVYVQNLKHIDEYKNTFKVIELYDGMNIPSILARVEDGNVTFATKVAIQKKWIVSGLPLLTQQLKSFLYNK